MSNVRSRLPPSFSTTVGTYANLDGSLPQAEEMLLATADFFAGLRRGVKPRLPEAMRDFRNSRGRGRLMKHNFGESAFHNEAWHLTGAGRNKLQLHFQGSSA